MRLTLLLLPILASCSHFKSEKAAAPPATGTFQLVYQSKVGGEIEPCG